MTESNDCIQVELAGQVVELLAQRAVYLIASQTLLVADLHLGKAATYRQLGQPVPQGTTSATLTRLSLTLQTRPVRQLVVLGDFLHAAQVHQAPQTLAAIEKWRAQHACLAITLVRGNHDNRAGDPPKNLAIDVVDEPYVVDGFECRHEPTLPASSARPSFVFAGHTHPVVTLQGRARDRLRLLCFVVSPKSCVLPAFGAFTGGHVHRRQKNETLYAIADEAIFALPGQASNRRHSFP
jgi:DNA ligase-associated metallophosphoesterase